jgi:hypothetical protein
MLPVHQYNFNDYFAASGLPASASFDPADVTQYWDALFDM